MTGKGFGLALLALAAGGGLLAYSCNSVECGAGTVEKNGKCVAQQDLIGGTECGPGTHLSGAMECVPDEYTCDPDTAYVDDAGVCKGKGSSSLPEPDPCPPVAADQVCVRGWLRDYDPKGRPPFGKDTLITDQSAEIWVFDPFVVLLCTVPPCMDTGGAIAGPYHPKADGTFLLDRDDQGRYIKGTGSYIAIGVRSIDGAADGPWAEGGITADGHGGITIDDFDIYAVGRAQVAAWDALVPPDDNGFSASRRGIFAMLFNYWDVSVTDASRDRTFIEGVLPYRIAPGDIPLDQLWFFTTDRNVIAQGNADGPNLTSSVGGAILLGETLGNHSGNGGTVPGSDPAEAITWEGRLGAAVPGLVFVQFFNQKLQ